MVLADNNGSWCGAGLEKVHISTISNSVTHLQIYTDSAIAENSAPISPETLSEHRCLCIERQYRYIE